MTIDGNPPTLLEQVFESARNYTDPTWDVSVRVGFTSPTGKEREVDAFWDGGRTWRVRFSPDEEGTWSYRTICSDASNPGLHGIEGSFTGYAYEGDNPLYRHGSLTLAENRRYLAHADGTPFFWLADTAWNGVLKAKPKDWEQYLAVRREQGFTAVQCVLTQWRSYEDELGFTGTEHINIRPEFFRRLDAKVAAIAEHGLLPALVLLWALTPKDPGNYLSEEDCIKLARYLVARYGAYRAVWLLGGDGRYLGDNVERWKRIGRGVFSDQQEHLATLHPAGMEWVADAFGGEAWFDFVSYQSGHGDDDKTLRWLLEGPPAKAWKEPALAVINQEPCYEAHLAYQSRQPFDAHKVRRALYWSLLVSPTAGVTYGHHGIWPWMEERGVPLDHASSGEAPTWREALASEGVASIGHLKALFSGLEWWKLRPAQAWLAEQPGESDPNRFVVIATAQDSSFAIAYVPAGDAFALRPEVLEGFRSAKWFDPRTGEWAAANSIAERRFTPPDGNDWLLLLKADE